MATTFLRPKSGLHLARSCNLRRPKSRTRQGHIGSSNITSPRHDPNLGRRRWVAESCVTSARAACSHNLKWPFTKVAQQIWVAATFACGLPDHLPFISDYLPFASNHSQPCWSCSTEKKKMNSSSACSEGKSSRHP